ncbi:helix-turn-helix domain-containing protein [Mesorhizobium sp. B3-1-3]|uniref:helix-turn-helix domain-containing protein n=1 Tax=unclassified Mesorhizobium TaxID=325217 RepID=UPI001127C6C0|nr:MULTISPECIES: helix-turn-helix domain-containing protein [unclassified Mesorhizobium]TPI64275.1 helix-turn-helix domain-containing protein [Mesorhizobium sp. B3-1-8]TPI70245.1 helix-turn-helix domain-containing protein [Mesorhizobium sp. B3-1-3]
MTPTKLLTQDEAAAILRCSASKVKRLRITGRLAYLPGRPVLIEESDLEAYMESVRRAAKPPATKEPKSARRASDGRKLTPSEMEDPGVLARRIWLARQNFQHDKQNKLKKRP